MIRLIRPDEARPLIEQALRGIEPIRQPIKLRADLLLARGALHSLSAQVSAALADYQRAYAIFGQVGEPRSQAIALASIASLYRDGRDYQNALRYYAQAADTYQGDPALTVAFYNNRGNVLIELKRFAEAERQFRAARKLAQQMGSGMLEAQVLRNVARGQLAAGALGSADRTITQGLAIATRAGSASLRAQFESVAAQAALQRGDLPRARSLIAQSFAGVDLTGTTLLFREAHQTAYRVYHQLGENALALQHLEALKRLDDETATLAASTNNALMAARFDFANQELRIVQLKAADLQRQKRSQQILFISIGAATAIVIALLSFGVVTLGRSRNRLAASNTALERALAAKTEFLATTSHEIRTPLNGILGMTQVMLADQKLDAGMRDRINVVHGAGVTMRALVDDILDVAKMETGNMTVEIAPMELRTMLTEVSRMWQDQARAKGLAFTVDLARAPRLIESDSARLRQIVFNLLSNAMKFTEQGSIALVAEVAGEGAGERLSISVRDTGVGIADDKHELIFESFKQADGGTTRRFGGTGLGLTICRNLARALGGDVRLESVAGEGSTFTVDLPLVRVEGAEAEPEVAPETLMVVDRNPITRAMMRSLFEKAGAVVQVASSIDEAEGMLQHRAAHQLLVDEATAMAAADPAAALERLVVLSARVVLLTRPLDASQHAAIAATGVRIVEKPIAGADLVQMLFTSSADASVSHLVSQAA